MSDVKIPTRPNVGFHALPESAPKDIVGNSMDVETENDNYSAPNPLKPQDDAMPPASTTTQQPPTTVVVTGPLVANNNAPPSIDMNNPKERYILHKRLRHSIYGEVYAGIDRSTGKEVAVKVSVLKLLQDHTSRNGINVMEDPMHEADILKAIGPHPHVVRLVDTHQDAKLHWMVQEFVNCGELFDLLVKMGHFNEQISRHFLLCLLAGLQHLHRRNVCHLDVSLENMLVGDDGYAKVCDLGLARRFVPGTLFPGSEKCKPGKINYMAPEIYAGRDFDGRLADIFSTGVVLFTMLTGHPPFESATLEDERYKLIAQGRLSHLLSALRMTDRVPNAAVDLLTRMMAYDPSRRPQSVEKVAAHVWVKGTNSS